MDPITVANLAILAMQTAAQIYANIQKANADKLKPLNDILSATNLIDDDGISVAQAEIDKLIQH